MLPSRIPTKQMHYIEEPTQENKVREKGNPKAKGLEHDKEIDSTHTKA